MSDSTSGMPPGVTGCEHKPGPVLDATPGKILFHPRETPPELCRQPPVRDMGALGCA